MAQQNGMENTSSSGFESFEIDPNSAASQDWLTSEESENASDSCAPRVVGAIPSFTSSLNSVSKSKVASKVLARKSASFIAVFGLGVLSALAVQTGMNESGTEKTQAESQSLADNSFIPSGTLHESRGVFDGSFRFDEYGSADVVPYDDLYGSRFSEPAGSGSVGLNPSSDSLFSASDEEPKDTFPTWVDLAPDSGVSSALTGLDGNVKEVSNDAIDQRTDREWGTNLSATSPQTPAKSESNDDVPLFQYSAARDFSPYQNTLVGQDSAFVSTPTYPQNVSEPQSDSLSDYNNSLGYNDKTNSAGLEGLKNSVIENESVDLINKSNYNDYSRENGIVSKNVSQNSFVPVAVRPPEDGRAGSSFQAFASNEGNENGEKSSVPAYVSSIPTFDNPHPDAAGGRRAFVAQKYEDAEPRQSEQPSSKTRVPALRW